jgi:hypothetical protein
MPNTYTLLETITVGAAGASSVTFNSIPQTGYTDLVLKISSRQNADTNAVMLSFTFNGNTTGYSRKNIYTDGTGIGNLTGTSEALSRFAFSNSSTFTANTFTNAELYIPNYTSSNAKSVSADGVAENNATLGYVSLSANLWSPVTQAPISSISIGISSGGSSFAQHSTFSLYGVSALGVIPTKAPKATGGSIIQTDGTYWYHAFLSSGTFTPATALSCDVLVVAGGGSGSVEGGAGGGAGGLLYFSSQSVGTSAQTITVGGGGAGVTGAGSKGNNGNDSQFAALTLVKGGGGGGNASTLLKSVGGTGGSGGGSIGANAVSGTQAGGAATSGQGFAGGSGSTDNITYRSSGGGGGAGVAGSNGNTAAPAVSGKGGNGLDTYSSFGSITGTGENIGGTYWFAGGGGGGEGTNAGAKGNGGGSAGTTGASSTAGLANSGGGSGGISGASNSSGNGGSGIVIVRYLA